MPLARICPGGIRQLMSLPETLLNRTIHLFPTIFIWVLAIEGNLSYHVGLD